MIGFDEELALSFDPFEGDRDVNVAHLSDKFVVGRKEHECHTCAGPIAKGERHRAKTERDDDERRIGTFRFCAKCCAAMTRADEWDDATNDYDRAYENRCKLRIMRREPERYADYKRLGLGLPPELEAEAQAPETAA